MVILLHFCCLSVVLFKLEYQKIESCPITTIVLIGFFLYTMRFVNFIGRYRRYRAKQTTSNPENYKLAK